MLNPTLDRPQDAPVPAAPVEIVVRKRTPSRHLVPMPRWKRALDIVVGSIALTVAAPVMGLIALHIRISSPGPILFSQTRVGRGGKPFTMWKFRTMNHGHVTDEHQAYMASLIQHDSDDDDAAPAMTKRDTNTDSLIAFGGWLRSSALDELPQLFNVVNGDMSLVGPRPMIPYEVDCLVHWHYGRFDTHPGMTGLWQVSGKNDLSFVQMIRLDIRYARSISPLRDVAIICKTPAVVVKQVLQRAGIVAPAQHSQDGK